MIMIICGLPGVGKSTLANKIAPRINAVILSSDKIRKEIFQNPTYSAFERKLVYDIMTIIAKYLNDIRISCILDATFNKEESRVTIKEKLGLEDRDFQIIECTCPENIAISRLESRKNDYSDATSEIYYKMKKIYEPVSLPHITIDTTIPIETNIEKVLKYIQ
ncbi:putative Kinase [Nitrosotalea sinensis]|uniref:Putative Kinase n=1 Tax=Nitrosotalea sinensis TaxID=1499975 RepID=A0A2H1EJ44_9ARCH|nr:AAA family ATPase [Candidatus Nitrosotalea sinensis]SHO47701.1 putative Kinase [Candidatus Nitrosotalea sinensis]